MRIYAVEEYNQDQELTKYWLFDNLEKAQDFVKQLRAWNSRFASPKLRAWNSFSKTYSINTTQITDPQDRE